VDTGLITVDEKLQFRVRILGVRNAYGGVRYRVEPTDGEGEATVDSSRVTLDSKPLDRGDVEPRFEK
jgi:hypothetical protein